MFKNINPKKKKSVKNKNKKTKFIVCPNCKHKVSKAARTCPECGHPIGFISWLIESKILLLITSLIGINGLWLIDFFKQEVKKVPAIIKSQDLNNENKDSKYYYITCPLCKGKGKIRCPKCKNSPRPGYIICDKCKGKGKIKCKKCNGSGYILKFDWNKRKYIRIKCPHCHGKGYLICPLCHGKGYFICTNCGGKGYITCPKCGGKKKIRVKK